MSYPDAPARDYSYTGFQTAQGDNSFPGTDLDNDLDNLFDFASETEVFLRVGHEEDGTIKIGSITAAMLDSGITIGLSSPRPWVTATAYAVDNTATINNNLYVCLVAHTSGTFSTDLAASKWAKMAEFAPLSTVDDGAITEAKHATGGVSTRALADGGVTAAKVASATLTRDKAAVSFGVVPVGSEMDFAGPRAPSGWLLEYGQAVSRTTYSELFTALTEIVSATTVNASATVTVAEDLRFLGLEGAYVEGAGITAGTTVVSITATTMTLSLAATASASGVSLRLLPHGRGDGSTTFNVPDRRGLVVAGLDVMGGAAASRLTSPAGSRLNTIGGSQTHTLATGEIPAHSHGVSDPGHTHSVTDSGHTHPVRQNTSVAGGGGGGFFPLVASGGTLDEATESATTGISVASGTTGITTQNAGGGSAHANVQPTGITNKIIFAGA